MEDGAAQSQEDIAHKGDQASIKVGPADKGGGIAEGASGDAGENGAGKAQAGDYSLEADSADGVGQAKVSVLPAAEEDAAAYLLVKVPGRDAPGFFLPGHILYGEADTLEVDIVTRQGRWIPLALKTGGEPALMPVQFKIIVGMEAFVGRVLTVVIDRV